MAADDLVYLAITRLLGRYADIATRKAWSEFAPLAEPDARFTFDTARGVVEVVGPEAFAAFGAQSLEGFSFYEYIPLNVVVKLETADTARGRVLSTYSATASDLDLEAGLGRLVQDASGNYYAWLNGTSMAAPHAVGVVALIRAAHPGMSRNAVVAMLRSSASGQPCPSAPDPGVAFFGAPEQFCSGGSGNNNFYGKGLVNALAASH